MAEVYGQFIHETGVDGYAQHYEPNTWERSDVLTPSLSIEEVLATRSLVMELRDRHGRSSISRNNRHVFAALNSSASDMYEAYDGSIQEYLSCSVAEVDHDQWRMRIRFRLNSLADSDVTRNVSYINQYLFDWTKSGNVQAWKANIEIDASEPETIENWSGIAPLTSERLEVVQEKMVRHIETIEAMRGAVTAENTQL